MGRFFCPNCGASISSENNFCPQCGLSMEEILQMLNAKQDKEPAQEVPLEGKETTQEVPLEGQETTQREPLPEAAKHSHAALYIFIAIITAISVGGAVFYFCCCRTAGEKKAGRDDEMLKNELLELQEQAHQDSLLRMEEARQRMQDSIACASFSSADLKTFWLHGHVREVTEESTDGSTCTYNFDRNGKLTYCSSYSSADYTVLRNNTRQIAAFVMNGEGDRYAYTTEGLLTTITSGDCKDEFKNYTKDGWPMQKTTTSQTAYDFYSDPSSTSTYKYKILYPETDKYGNWTRRETTLYYRSVQSTDYWGNPQTEESTPNDVVTTTRTISYYETRR